MADLIRMTRRAPLPARKAHLSSTYPAARLYDRAQLALRTGFYQLCLVSVSAGAVLTLHAYDRTCQWIAVREDGLSLPVCPPLVRLPSCKSHSHTSPRPTSVSDLDSSCSASSSGPSSSVACATSLDEVTPRPGARLATLPTRVGPRYVASSRRASRHWGSPSRSRSPSRWTSRPASTPSTPIASPWPLSDRTVERQRSHWTCARRRLGRSDRPRRPLTVLAGAPQVADRTMRPSGQVAQQERDILLGLVPALDQPLNGEQLRGLHNRRLLTSPVRHQEVPNLVLYRRPARPLAAKFGNGDGHATGRASSCAAKTRALRCSYDTSWRTSRRW